MPISLNARAIRQPSHSCCLMLFGDRNKKRTQKITEAFNKNSREDALSKAEKVNGSAFKYLKAKKPVPTFLSGLCSAKSGCSYAIGALLDTQYSWLIAVFCDVCSEEDDIDEIAASIYKQVNSGAINPVSRDSSPTTRKGLQSEGQQ